MPPDEAPQPGLPEHDEAGARILKRAFQTQAVLGAVATLVAFARGGRFSAQSVFLGAFFGGAHLFTVMKSVRSTFDGEALGALAQLFVIFRSLRFLSVLVAAALVLVAGLASPVGFLFGYALLVPAIAIAVLPRSGDET
jgi:hypothetical protein